MSDIFISYAKADRSRVQALVHAFERRGWSVWWDPEIPAGRAFDDVISEQLRQAHSVVVIWSDHSLASHWVREEAEVARARGVLVPILLDAVTPPLGFGRIQAADLTGWNGDESTPAFKRLIEDLAGRMAQGSADDMTIARHGELEPTTAASTVSSSRPKRRKWMAWALIVSFVVIGLGFATFRFEREAKQQVVPSGAAPSSVGSAPPSATAPAKVVESATVTTQVNLLSAEQGGELLVADGNYWSQAIDGKGDKFSFYAGQARAVFGFKGEAPATFHTFAVLIEDSDGYNVKEFELLVGDESPTGAFRSLGTFTTHNAKLLKSPYQTFSFAPVTAKYLQVKLLSAHGEALISAREFRLLGTPPSSAVVPIKMGASTTAGVNLLSPEQGGELLVADGNYWSQAIDGKGDKFSFYAGQAQAVFGFKGEAPATFHTFAVLIEDSDGYNVKEFELLVGDESPTGAFRSLGTFATHNAKLFKSPYQTFSFAPVTAKYLQVKLLSAHSEALISAREFRLLGTPPSSAAAATPPTKTTASTPVTAQVNLLSAEQGGELLVADGNYWSQAIDGKGDKFSFYAGQAQAVFGFKGGAPATFHTFSVLVEDSDGYNVKEFELLIGDESPTGAFRSLGTFATHNAKLFKSPYQTFSFAPVTAKYLQVKLLSAHSEALISAREFRLLGRIEGG